MLMRSYAWLFATVGPFGRGFQNTEVTGGEQRVEIIKTRRKSQQQLIRLPEQIKTHAAFDNEHRKQHAEQSSAQRRNFMLYTGHASDLTGSRWMSNR